jgi:hypothetical protein
MPKSLKTWNVRECGWETYFAEVAALSKGRTDVRVYCPEPGIITLVQL